jgi:hypothetical protein
MNVPAEAFEIDTANNFIVNNFIDKTESKPQPNTNLPESLLCNFSGYDLAKLNNKYANTLIGRNILYGQNLRESLNKTAKTFEKMFDTIDKEPQLFLYYNNGITIISSYFNAKSKGNSEEIIVKDFSIINGAQTTSTLGSYLRNAELNNDFEKIENLKKVFVLTKIYQISKDLKNHELISERIKIYTNTQTPLSSRDMVSIRPEQILLNKNFLEAEPYIYINIKKGGDVPNYPKTLPHQRVTNEILAQISLCGFLSQPFTAKDRKTKIFDTESKEGYNLNEVYHKLFDIKDGILFKKSNLELDELLFVYRMHEDSKKVQKNFLKDQLNNIYQTAATDEFDKITKEDQSNRIRRNMEISNVCLFWNITTYYQIKKSFDNYIKDFTELSFDYKKYYSDKNFKDKVIKLFLQLCFSKTVEIIRKNSGQENVPNWLRVEKNEKVFLSNLKEQLLNDGINIREQYKDFILATKIKMSH